jgi:hypothetical protein
VEEKTDFAKLAMKKLMPKAVKDQYQEYITGSRVLHDPGNLFHWWANQSHPDAVGSKKSQAALAPVYYSHYPSCLVCLAYST